MRKSFFLLLIITSSLTLKAQWVQMSNGMGTQQNVWSLGSCRNNILEGGQDIYTSSSYTYLSSNNGLNWSQTSFVGIPYCFYSNDTIVLAGTNSNGIYRSTNNGLNWSQVGLTTNGIYCFANIGSNIFAGSGYTVYISTNSGLNWSYTSLNINSSIYTLAVSGTFLYAGVNAYTGGTGVYLSTNFGQNWTPIGLDNKQVNALVANGSNVFAGTSVHGVYFSSNNGQNWTQTSLNYNTIGKLAIYGSIIFATIDTGICLSINNGVNWIKKNQGFDAFSIITAVLIKNNYIFAGTFGHSVWRRSLSEIIGIQNISSEIPSKYFLHQNYPNPFNPATKIQFDISNASNVKLIIFDITGKEIAALVNEKLNAGTYEAMWNAENYPSGVYFYKLITDNFVDTKKLILVK